MFVAIASDWKRGKVERRSFAGKIVGFNAPVKKDRPSGLNGTMVMPRSLQTGITSFSRSRNHSEYSLCTAAI